MKKLIVLAALLPLVAYSQIAIIGSFDNKGGGKITFMGYQGECPEGQYMVYTHGANGKITSTGCYRYVSGQFFVAWDDGSVYTYDTAGFVLSEEAKQFANSERR